MDFAAAREKALGRLSRRECGSVDLARFLVARGTDPSVAESVVADLVRLGLLDDSRFARMLVRDQLLKGKGPRMIALKLREKGLSFTREQIAEWTAELSETSDLQRALAIVERRYPEAWDRTQSREELRKEQSRAFQALVRRGFAIEVAQSAVFKGKGEPK